MVLKKTALGSALLMAGTQGALTWDHDHTQEPILQSGSNYQNSVKVDLHTPIPVGGDRLFNSVRVYGSGRVSFEGDNGQSIQFKSEDFGVVSIEELDEPDDMKIFYDHNEEVVSDDELVWPQHDVFTFKYTVDGLKTKHQLAFLRHSENGEENIEFRAIKDGEFDNLPAELLRTTGFSVYDSNNVEICATSTDSSVINNYLNCDLAFNDCFDQNAENAPDSGSFDSVFYTSADDTFGKIQAVLTCQSGEKLYPVGVPIIGEDLPNFEIYNCEYDPDFYTYVWNDGQYECQPEKSYYLCPAGIYDCVHGDCYTDGFEVECRCHPGFTATEDVRACNLNIDECEEGTHLCSDNGICMDLDPAQTGYGYTCLCNPEWDNDSNFVDEDDLVLGGLCDVRHNDCLDFPCQLGGDDNAICTDGERSIPGFPAYSCTCSDDFFFDGFSNEPTCVRANPCRSDPCQNGGRCNWDGGESYECTCRERFEGPNCENEISICDLNDPCQNGGACSSDDEQGYRCDCADGWKGKTCALPIQTIDIRNVMISRPEQCVNGDGSQPTDADNAIYIDFFLPRLEAFWINRGATQVDFLGTLCRTHNGKGRHGRFAIQMVLGCGIFFILFCFVLVLPKIGIERVIKNK